MSVGFLQSVVTFPVKTFANQKKNNNNNTKNNKKPTTKIKELRNYWQSQKFNEERT